MEFFNVLKNVLVIHVASLHAVGSFDHAFAETIMFETFEAILENFLEVKLNDEMFTFFLLRALISGDRGHATDPIFILSVDRLRP